MTKIYKKATLAGGCFWCIEAVFKNLKGVVDVVSGYAGGDMENPSYEDVSAGTSNHAEAVQITYDPEKISFSDLLFVFWRMHDPTTKDRQGADVGPQYRSAIFYHSDEQKKLAQESKKETEVQKIYEKSIVTEIVPLKAFYPAEDYHQNFYAKNPKNSYCRVVIDPKVAKLKKEFSHLLKN